MKECVVGLPIIMSKDLIVTTPTPSEANIPWKYPDALERWMLAAAYCYYVLDTPVISDGAFDRMCKELGMEMDIGWTPTRTQLIDRESLRAGTVLALGEDYPEYVRQAAKRWIDVEKDRKSKDAF